MKRIINHKLSFLSRSRQTLLVMALVFYVSMILVGCGGLVDGNGAVMEREFQLQAIKEVVIHSSLRVSLRHSDVASGKIVADSNLMSLIKVEQHGGTLDLRLEGQVEIQQGTAEVFLYLPKLPLLRIVAASKVVLPCLQTKGDLRLDISGHSIVQIDAQTDGKMDIELAGASLLRGTINAKHTKWKLTGASVTNVTIDAIHSTIDASGASKVTMDGFGTHLSFVLAGNSHGTFTHYHSGSIQANLSGSSRAWIAHNGELAALIEGLSLLWFQGRPKITSLHTSGGGQLSPMKEAQ